jgi:16S rRNA (cytosine1402-N4)-methyltransferase
MKDDSLRGAPPYSDQAADQQAAVSTEHIPVLADETLQGLRIRSGDWTIDGTLGGGGHAARILRQSEPDGHLLGLDADPAAIQRAKRRFTAEIAAGRMVAAHANFADVETVAKQHGFTGVHAILLDLGVSSFQLAEAERGFSLQADGPLDMRMNPDQEITAWDIVNTWSERDLADLIYEYGEERHSRRIAKTLVARRPIERTIQLAEIVEQALGGRRGQRIHPATRTFQALRIGVNQELSRLEQALPQCLRLLRPGGRLAVISFHSLEDRIVKRWIQQEAADFLPDPAHPMGGVPKQPAVAIITRKPITAADVELRHNPRSRSAKLRIAERIQ